MATVEDILQQKGRQVVSLAASESALEAARVMNERGIGGVLVTRDFEPVGIFTERDMMRRVVAKRRDPVTTSLEDVMTTSVITVKPSTSIEDCVAIITQRRVRHIPVIDQGRLAGIITSGDILAHQVADRETTIVHLLDYITGVPKWTQAPGEEAGRVSEEPPSESPQIL